MTLRIFAVCDQSGPGREHCWAQAGSVKKSCGKKNVLGLEARAFYKVLAIQTVSLKKNQTLHSFGLTETLHCLGLTSVSREFCPLWPVCPSMEIHDLINNQQSLGFTSIYAISSDEMIVWTAI